MGEMVRVSNRKQVIENGVISTLISEDGREWSKFYPTEGAAGHELNEMGLVSHQTSQPSDLILHVRSYMKDGASIDVETIERYGYAPRTLG